MTFPAHITWPARLLLIAFALTCAVYWPGLYGDWISDDVPNILSNADVQPQSLSLRSLADAALSSPSSSLKRPLASLTFLGNFLVSGLDPFGWKLFNLAIHLLNGLLVFALARTLIRHTPGGRPADLASGELTAALIAAAWLLLPVNLTGVLYVVQRMESLANLFVLGGLLGYLRGRERMLAGEGGFAVCAASLVGGTLLGLSAKETTILLPLYAALIELLLLRFRRAGSGIDGRLLTLFGAILIVPGLIGSVVLVPWVTDPQLWAHRDFTLATRLLSEARVVVSYLWWTLLPSPNALSFHHDDVVVSSGLLAPWTTLTSLAAIAALTACAWWARQRQPLFALGIALFFAGHLLTATVIPLELVFEHRNYFASFGLLLAVVPLLTQQQLPLRLARQGLLVLLFAWWAGLTAATAYAWGDGLRLANELAQRAPESPRALVGLGAELVRRSGPDAASPLLLQGYAVLERTATMTNVSIRPEQIMIYTDAVLGRETQAAHWKRVIDKLGRRSPSAEDLSALAVLTQCARKGHCPLPKPQMQAAFTAALVHGSQSARLLTIYSDYAWNLLGDRALAQQLTESAIRLRPNDADSRVALARMHIVQGRPDLAREQLQALQRLNRSGELQQAIDDLRRIIESREAAMPP